MTRSRWQVFLAAILAIGILYWAVGASVGASRVRGQIHELLAGTSDQTLALDYLRFNPFTMTAKFEGLRLSDVNTGPVLTVPAGQLRLGLTALIGEVFTVRDLFLEQPSLHVSVSGPIRDRRLRSLGSFRPSIGSPGKPRPIHIVRAKVDSGHVTIFEAADSGDISTSVDKHISELQLELADWKSDAMTPASFDLTARISDSGALSVQGDWVPASHTVEANIELNGLVLTPFATHFDTWLTDVRLAGVLAAQGRFIQHAGSGSFEGDLVVEQLSVDDTTGQSVFSADKLTARGVKIGGERWPATVEWVDMERPGVVLHLAENGQLNLRRLIVGTVPRIDKTTMRDGLISFTDERLPSMARIEADKIVGEISRRIDGPQETLAISLTGDTPGQWIAKIGGVFHRNDNQVRAEGDATFSGLDAGAVSAYFSSLTAREIVGGLLDFELHYSVDDTDMAISSQVVLKDLQLSTPVGESPASNLPLDLAIALLNDENHQMRFELPVNVTKTGSGFALRQAFDLALTDFIDTTTAKPLAVVARLANLDIDEVSRTIFAAGSTEILPAVERQLTALVDALAQRPQLGVRFQGRFAARSDRAALARRQVALHIALAASTQNNNPSAQAKPDFSDPKVQAVLDEFAAARLDAGERDALRAGGPENDDEATTTTQRSYYPAVFEALAAKEAVSDYALRQLARYRAHSLVGRLQELGIQTQRLEVDKRAVAVVAEDGPATVALTLMAYKRPGN